MKILKVLAIVAILASLSFAVNPPTRASATGNYIVKEITRLYSTDTTNLVLKNGATGYIYGDSVTAVDTVVILKNWYPTPGLEYIIGNDSFKATGLARDSGKIVFDVVARDDSGRVIAKVTADTLSSTVADNGGYHKLPIFETIFGYRYSVWFRQYSAGTGLASKTFLPRMYLFGRAIQLDKPYNY
jgi:hypothetical protein